MKSKKGSLATSLFLLSTFVLTTLNPARPVDAGQRARRLETPNQIPQTLPARTPSPSPTPVPLGPPQPIEAPPTTSLPKSNTTTRSVAELQTRITEILRKPELSSAMIGIKVTSLDTGRVLFEENAQKLLRPASNMKIYTIATALDRLSPDFRFNTSVYAQSKPSADGVIKGDVTIFGRGDPSIAARFNNGDYLKGIDDLANRIVGAGVKRVEGDLVGDESYFVGPKYGSGWEWEDLTWYYGAEITPLTINDNALDLFVKPGAAVGARASITTGPPDPLLTIVNEVTTTARGTQRKIAIHRGLAADKITISGTIGLDDRGYIGGIGISHPGLLFVYLLRAALTQKGVVVTGKSRASGPIESLLASSIVSNQPASAVEIATLQSPPFSVIAAQTLKPSQNLYAELILRTLGKVVPPQTTDQDIQTSEDLGLEAVKAFLKSAGIRPEALVLGDGSGLSRNDMITAEASVELLSFMSRHRYASVFRDALPIAGVDGTLRNRLKNTVAENNLRAKTGSLSSAASLAGYVTTVAGEHLAFSIMVNNYSSDVEPRTVCIDPIALLLASFDGRSS
ncbi:MAG TPA: D-alanyl-D-alanine carboxypeptidase/D-alanyl-D-alanine-endopeptidase [Pyrinomonadaceae bacterium]|nr:D-alanyl-D-alanine carboxypeptidase/D-alanyl-D-alanine-endopeptidase [Pyrinomonadaceae bacterium]